MALADATHPQHHCRTHALIPSAAETDELRCGHIAIVVVVVVTARRSDAVITAMCVLLSSCSFTVLDAADIIMSVSAIPTAPLFLLLA